MLKKGSGEEFQNKGNIQSLKVVLGVSDTYCITAFLKKFCTRVGNLGAIHSSSNPKGKGRNYRIMSSNVEQTEWSSAASEEN